VVYIESHKRSSKVIQRSLKGQVEVKVGFLMVIRGFCALGRSVGSCLCPSRDDEEFYEMTSLPNHHSDR